MRLEVINDTTAFELLSDEWNSLLSRSASHVPFLRHEYLRTWWRTLGGGEWERAELYIVTARREDDALCGITPLFFTENHEGKAALMLLGSIEISDFLDVIVQTEDAFVFLDRLLEHLAGEMAPAWETLDFYNLLDTSHTLQALRAAAERRGWVYNQQPLQHCPYIPLPGDWETYLAGIDKKQRHEIRRKMRRVEEAGEAIRWYIVEDGDRLEQEIEGFFDLMAQDEEKKVFLTERMCSQMQAALQVAFQNGWLQLAFLEINGEKAAGYANFDYDNHIWVYNSGMDFRFGVYSPGWVLLGYLLKWANEHGRACFDFMRGGEDYKYRFGGVDRLVVRATVRR